MDSFLSLFKSTVKDIEAKTHLSVESESIEQHFKNLSEELEALRAKFNEASRDLTNYDNQKCMEQLKSLQEKIMAQKNSVAPPKKFSFKSRPKASPKINSENENEPKIEVKKEEEKKFDFEDLNTVSFKQLENEKIKVITGYEKKDLTLSELKNCEIIITCPFSSVHINKVENSTIVLGPTSSSVFMDECNSSTLVLACHQFRMHKSTNCDIYLHVTSHPIIEDCHSLQFAPYSLTYNLLDQHFLESTLDKSINFWDKVEDFKWLKQTKSPNWDIQPEEKRRKWDL